MFLTEQNCDRIHRDELPLIFCGGMGKIMKKSYLSLVVDMLLITSTLLSACNYYAVPTVSEEELAMQVAGTRAALSTQSAVETMIVQLEELKNQPTCPACPTCPPAPTATPIETVEPTEENPQSVIITPIGDVTNPDCLRFDFLGDVNYPPDSVLEPNEEFTKTWWVRNSGACSWTKQFDLVLSGGDPLGTDGTSDFTIEVAPGESVQLSLPGLVAPSSPGTYYSYWLISTPLGRSIGYGPNQQWGLGIKIIVAFD